MRHYRVTFSKDGRERAFIVSGLSNAYAPARAFLEVTNHATPARSTFEALPKGARTSFGEGGLGCVAIERLD